MIQENIVLNNGVEKLGTAPIGPLLWKYILPAIAGLLTHALYNVVDKVFIGQFQGQLGLSALTIVSPVMMFFLAFALLIGGGGAALISIRLGEGKHREAANILGNAMTTGLIISVAIPGFGLLFAKETLVLFGANAEMLPYALDYYRIIILGLPFATFGFALYFIIRAEGNPKLAILLMVVSSAVNLVLDPIFIVGLHMGVNGAAWATVIAEIVVFILGLNYYVTGRSALKLRLSDFIPLPRLGRQIFLMGLPVCITEVMMSLQNILLNLQLAKHGGTVAVASMGIIYALYTIVEMPIFAVADSLQPIIGYNYGAKNFERVRQTVRLVVFAIMGISISFIVPIILKPGLFIAIFTSDEDVLGMTTKGLQIFMLGLPFFGLYFSGTRYFQSIDKAFFATLVSFCKPIAFFIPILYLAGWAWGLDGIWITEPLSLFLVFLVVFMLYCKENKRLR